MKNENIQILEDTLRIFKEGKYIKKEASATGTHMRSSHGPKRPLSVKGERSISLPMAISEKASRNER